MGDIRSKKRGAILCFHKCNALESDYDSVTGKLKLKLCLNREKNGCNR